MPKPLVPLILALILLWTGAAQAMGDHDYLETELTDRASYLRQAVGVRESVSGNVVIFEQSAGYVIFDAGYSDHYGNQIVAAIDARGTGKPVTAIVISHWHDDHSMGLGPILARWPEARIISSSATREAIAREYGPQFGPGRDADRFAHYLESYERFVTQVRARAASSEIDPALRTDYERSAGDAARAFAARRMQRLYLPVQSFSGSLILHDPDFPIELHHLGRANTNGDIIAWAPADRIIATGDIVVAPMPYGFGSFPAEWLETIARISAFDFAYLVPGHGEVQRDRSYLTRLTALIEATHSAVFALLDENVPADEVAAQIDLGPMRREFTQGQMFREILFDRYWLEPMIANEMRERSAEE